MSFKKYPKIETLGHEDTNELLSHNEDFIAVEEKVDGGNGSFWIDNLAIHFGSRNRDLTVACDTKAFARCQVALREHLEKLEKKRIKINPDFIYYIEWMKKHTISYTKAPLFVGLDIRLRHSADTEDYGLFLGRESKEQEFKRLKIECIPLVWKGKAGELKKLDINDIIPKSKYYEGFAEGIVIKNYNRKHPRGNHQIFGKVVREEFKECNKAVFGSVRQKDTDTMKIVDEFITDARVRKMVLKQVNEYGNKLDLKLMSIVPREVIKDVLEEEFGTIFNKYKFIDFREMKQKSLKICLRVIKELMMEKVIK